MTYFRVLPFFLMLFLLNACSAISHKQTYFFKNHNGYSNVIHVSVHDTITKQTMRDFENLSEKFKDKPFQTVYINLNSFGGDIDAFIGISKYLNKLRKEHNVNVVAVVEKKNICASACTLIFAVADERIASETSIFIFHSPWIFLPTYDPSKNQNISEATRKREMEIISSTRNEIYGYYKEVDKELADFLKKNYLWEVNKDYITTGKELSDNYKKYITKLVPLT